jgi:hypothetical protein
MRKIDFRCEQPCFIFSMGRLHFCSLHVLFLWLYAYEEMMMRDGFDMEEKYGSDDLKDSIFLLLEMCYSDLLWIVLFFFLCGLFL